MKGQQHSKSSSSMRTEHKRKLLQCGFVTGLIQAVAFNPWDRALYLSVKNDRPFLTGDNFKAPFAGVFQTLLHRALSAGLYFPLEEIFLQELREAGRDMSQFHPLHLFSAGIMAGAVGAIVLNPMSCVKYQYWGDESRGSFLNTSKKMFQQGGLRPFFVGINPTLLRDVIFGGSFSFMRHYFAVLWVEKKLTPSPSSGELAEKREVPFVVNVISASLATVLSSPVNYVRNIHYSISPSQRSPSLTQIMKNLWNDAESKFLSRYPRHDSISLRLTRFVFKLRYFQRQFRIGWGTARVGVGMAFSAKVYDICAEKFDSV